MGGFLSHKGGGGQKRFDICDKKVALFFKGFPYLGLVYDWIFWDAFFGRLHNKINFLPVNSLELDTELLFNSPFTAGFWTWRMALA